MTTAWRDLDKKTAAILSAYGGEQVVAVYPATVRAVGGDGNAAIFLSQLIYWAKRTKDRDGWFYNTADQLEQQTGLGKRAQATARKNLKALGLMEDRLKGSPPIVHFRLDLAKVAELLAEAQFSLQRENQFDRMRENQFSLQRENQFDRTGEDPIQRLSEITEETTPAGVSAPPTPSGDAPGPAVVEEMATVKNDPTPPTPSPRADTVDNAVILDLRSRRKEKEALRSTGWHEYPDRLQRIRDGLEKGWTRKNPARFDRKALDMVARSVAPDEADRFEKKTVAYLRSVDDPQYLLSLRRWLEEWREREPERDRPMNQAEINSAWLLAMKPITREEIAQ